MNPILKSSVSLILITLIVKILGYSEKLVLAYYWGTGFQVDSFTLVTTIVMSVFFLFREIVEPGFLNVFMRIKLEKGETLAMQYFNTIFCIIAIVTLVISLFCILFPDSVINLFAPGFSTQSRQITVKLLKFTGPAIIFLALSTLSNITLNGLKQFATAAFGDVAQKATIVIVLVLLYSEWGIYGAALGAVGGSIIKLLIHLTIIAKRKSFCFKASIDGESLKKTWLLTWPLLIGVLFSQLSNLIDNICASTLGEGGISALSYSRKLADLPILLLPYALSVVIFPYLSQYSIEGQDLRMKQLLVKTIKLIIIVFFPISICCITFSIPIVEIVFQRGAFDISSTILTAQPFSIYATGMIIFALETIVVVYFFAIGDTKTPVYSGIGCTLINIVLTYGLVTITGYLGVAISLVASKLIKIILLLGILYIRNQLIWPSFGKDISIFSIAALTFSILIGVICNYILPSIDFSTKVQKMLMIGVSSFIASIPFMVILYKYLRPSVHFNKTNKLIQQSLIVNLQSKK